MATPFPISNPPLVCWNCHERTIGTHFCPGCGKVLQVPDHSDYFFMLGFPRRLWLDMGMLEQKFLELSWKLHPDNFVNATPEEREISLKRSSELNDAYRTLRDPVSRVESLDELREAKAAGSDVGSLRQRLTTSEQSFEEKLKAVDGELQLAARKWDQTLDAGADEDAKKRVMSQLNDLLNRRSYIRNLVVNVQKELL
jgi:molecular chaperone HscB